jgi:FAD:protein FMN transferase
VDRALDVLIRAGIRRGVVNAGGSSIGAIGAPPRADGWPVRLGEAEGPALLLRDRSMSTSRYEPSEPARGGPSDIIDARSGSPAGRRALTIVSRDAATADALSTALTMMTIDEGRSLLRRTPGVAALWLADDGRIAASYGELTPLLARAH